MSVLSDQPPLELLVYQARWVADGIIAFDLVHPQGLALPQWDAGAHIDVVLPSGIIRQYSLCGDLEDPFSYRIAVLLEESSRGGSSEMHRTQLVGRRLAIQGPRNHFPLVDAAGYLFLAGGIGVTPMVPMLQTAERRGVPWRLIYGARSRRTMAFIAEIGGRRGGCLELVPEDEAGLPDLGGLLAELPTGWKVYCCGPPGMIRAVEQRCPGVDAGVLHLERFTAATDQQVREGDEASFEVELARTGTTITVPPDRSILRTVLDAVPTILYSCEEGYCGTCEVRVLEGQPDHRDTVLTDEEKAEHKMMICVSRSRSARLVLDI